MSGSVFNANKLVRDGYSSFLLDYYIVRFILYFFMIIIYIFLRL